MRETLEFAKQHDIKYYCETSAKTGERVANSLMCLVHKMLGIDLPSKYYPKVMKKYDLMGKTSSGPNNYSS
ncbi:MAG: hypothetical protein ACTSRA_17270 [Promethearchaeota archaeon]